MTLLNGLKFNRKHGNGHIRLEHLLYTVCDQYIYRAKFDLQIDSTRVLKSKVWVRTPHFELYNEEEVNTVIPQFYQTAEILNKVQSTVGNVFPTVIDLGHIQALSHSKVEFPYLITTVTTGVPLRSLGRIFSVTDSLILILQLIGAVEKLHNVGYVHTCLDGDHLFVDIYQMQVRVLSLSSAVKKGTKTTRPTTKYTYPKKSENRIFSVQDDIYAIAMILTTLLLGSPHQELTKSSTPTFINTRCSSFFITY
jgi:serine/threonine protein kinase